ncbi:CHC2 zinc finger domain-containing protein, partial [Hydrogenivirga sp.]
MKEGKEAINIVWQTLFPVKSLPDGEYVEVVFDDGDKNFKYCLHLQEYDELEGFLKEYDGKVNIAICPNTRIPRRRKFMKRTGKGEVKRQKAVLLDIEDPDNHSLTQPSKVREHIRVFAQEAPENIRKAVKYSAYTGGGGQICIELSRWIEGGEMEIVYEYLKKRLKHIKYIDPKSFNYGQPQRLIGTINTKYGVRTAIYKVNEECTPLDVDRILETWEAQQELENYTANQIDENKGKVQNLNEAIALIKQKVRFKDLGFEGEEYGDYTKISCPFHEETNPSFVVYHNEDADIAIDYHNDESYDIIKFYQKVYEKSFMQAVRELAQRAGIKLVFTKEEKKRIEKEQALAEFDQYEYIGSEL